MINLKQFENDPKGPEGRGSTNTVEGTQPYQQPPPLSSQEKQKHALLNQAGGLPARSIGLTNRQAIAAGGILKETLM